jgi:hypothetical protein
MISDKPITCGKVIVMSGASTAHQGARVVPAMLGLSMALRDRDLLPRLDDAAAEWKAAYTRESPP